MIACADTYSQGWLEFWRNFGGEEGIENIIYFCLINLAWINEIDKRIIKV
jgi:hypothetical protein